MKVIIILIMLLASIAVCNNALAQSNANTPTTQSAATVQTTNAGDVDKLIKDAHDFYNDMWVNTAWFFGVGLVFVGILIPIFVYWQADSTLKRDT